MAEQLCSVGLDVGTTTTQLIVSRLTVENRASAFTVPEMRDEDGQPLTQPRKPQMRFTMQLPQAVPPLSLLRRYTCE